MHDSVTDPKYDGVRTSRKQLLEESDEDVASDDEDVDGSAPSQSEEEGFSDAPNERGPDKDSEGTDEEGSAPQQSNEEATRSPSDRPSGEPVNEAGSQPVNNTELNGDLASSLRKTREEDREKGRAVSRQIVRHLFDHAGVSWALSVCSTGTMGQFTRRTDTDAEGGDSSKSIADSTFADNKPCCACMPYSCLYDRDHISAISLSTTLRVKHCRDCSAKLPHSPKSYSHCRRYVT